MHSCTMFCAAFLALQLAVGVTWFCTLTPLAKQVGLASVGMVGAYPLMKRVTYWPQVGVGWEEFEATAVLQEAWSLRDEARWSLH